ncbi:hypothetical protein NHQ30_006456 [Ciborinia camelliae]|nr:hypothetical protein NHQ30_006456 [Ciborinia camelliae]
MARTTAVELDLLGKLKILTLPQAYETGFCATVSRIMISAKRSSESSMVNLSAKVSYFKCVTQILQQKMYLKRIPTERCQFRIKKYNVEAYSAPSADRIALAPPRMPSIILLQSQSL